MHVNSRERQPVWLAFPAYMYLLGGSRAEVSDPKAWLGGGPGMASGLQIRLGPISLGRTWRSTGTMRACVIKDTDRAGCDDGGCCALRCSGVEARGGEVHIALLRLASDARVLCFCAYASFVYLLYSIIPCRQPRGSQGSLATPEINRRHRYGAVCSCFERHCIHRRSNNSGSHAPPASTG